jgi:cytochrome c-type biogenesis protein CcmH
VRRWLPWALLAAVVAVALVVGTAGGDGEPSSREERVMALAADFRCPTCRGQSVADSDAPAAAAIRQEIARQVGEGRSDDEIRDYVLERYPRSQQVPPRSGLAGLVWVLPVAAAVAAGAGLVLAFRRWRVAPGAAAPSPEDRVLVERARRR